MSTQPIAALLARASASIHHRPRAARVARFGPALLLTAGLLLPSAPQALAAPAPHTGTSPAAQVRTLPTDPHVVQPDPHLLPTKPNDPNPNTNPAPTGERVVHTDQPQPLTGAAAAGTSLVNNASIISGPLSVHLVYTDQNGQQQDLDVANAVTLPAALPDGLRALHTSPLLTQSLNSGFEQVWNSLQAQDCSDVVKSVQGIHNLGNNNDVSAYNVSGCTWATGFLPTVIATQVSRWGDPPAAGRNSQDGLVSGQELLLDYWIPANTVTFTVTTSTTGGIGNVVGDSDPQFTLLFDIHLYITLSDVGATSLTCPMTVADLWNMDPVGQKVHPQISQTITMDELLQGNQSAAITSAFEQAGASAGASLATAVASGGAVSAADMAITAAKLVASLVGSGASAVAGSSVQDTVALGLRTLGLSAQSPLDSMAPLSDFDAFNSGCGDANGQGFTQLDVAAMPDGSLRFTLTHPPFTNAPTLQVSDVTSGSLIGPSITSSAPEVNAGDQLMVAGTSFNPQQSDVWLTWGSSGTPGADLEENAGGSGWEPATYTAFYSGNQVTGLTPNTPYQFRVRACDAWTCSPYSNTVGATSTNGGTDRVSFYLDSVDPKNRIPNASAALINGAFDQTVVTIPHDTPAGSHTLYAAIGDGWSQASTPLQVVAAGERLTPVIQLTDSFGDVTNLTTPGTSITIAGQNFVAGHPVKISVDKANSQALDSATVNPGGQFTLTVSIPSLAGGTHTLLATQVVNGKTIQASASITVELIE